MNRGGINKFGEFFIFVYCKVNIVLCFIIYVDICCFGYLVVLDEEVFVKFIVEFLKNIWFRLWRKNKFNLILIFLYFMF